MRRLPIALALVVHFAALSTGAAPQTPLFSTEVRIVPIYATVRDRATGRLVTNLTKTDFAIREDDAPREIASFSSESQPIRVMLDMDMSHSMWPALSLMRNAALTFAHAMQPEDNMRIGTFSSARVTTSAVFTHDELDIRRTLMEELWPGGDSPVWNGINRSIVALEGSRQRLVLLAMTDGHNNLSLPGLDSSGDHARTHLLASNIMFYVIGPPGCHLDHDLIKLADTTGGGHFELDAHGDLSQTMSQVSEELHRQYLLGFEPLAFDNAVHRVLVSAKNPAYDVRAQTVVMAAKR